MSSAFRLLNFYKKGSRPGQHHLLKKEQALFQLNFLQQVYSPLRGDLKPLGGFYQQQEDEKKLELYSLFTPVLQEKSFRIHEKFNIRGF